MNLKLHFFENQYPIPSLCIYRQIDTATYVSFFFTLLRIERMRDSGKIPKGHKERSNM